MKPRKIWRTFHKSHMTAFATWQEVRDDPSHFTGKETDSQGGLTRSLWFQ